MAMSTPYPIQLDFTAEARIARWRPFVQWVLAIPHLDGRHVYVASVDVTSGGSFSGGKVSVIDCAGHRAVCRVDVGGASVVAICSP